MEAGTMERPATAEGDAGGGDAPPVDELKVTATQLQFPSMGGKKPTGSTFKLTGGKVDLGTTCFKKGETVVLEVICVVNNVGQVDKHDVQTGIPVSCEQRHSARVVDIRVLPAPSED